MPRATVRLEDLMVETSDLRRAGRIDPEGAEWWLYTRTSDCFTSFRTQRPRNRPQDSTPQVVRFASRATCCPWSGDTLRWGDLARRSRGWHGFGRRNDNGLSSTLSGRGESGEPLTGPSSTPSTCQLTTTATAISITLQCGAPEGLSPPEFQAVLSMTHLNPGRGREPVQLVYQAHGAVDDFAGVSPLFGTSTRWRSLTPYVLTRHVKYRGPRDENGYKRQVDGPEDQIRREVGLRWPDSASVERVRIKDPGTPIEPLRQGRSGGVRPIDFFRHRQGGSNGGGSYNFTVELAQPVRGPIALGFACHYGLGLFVPSD